MQSYPLHTHNIVLFLVSSWKQTFGVRRVVSVADRAWENIGLTFSSLWVRHSILITSTFGNCYDDSLHLVIITHHLITTPQCIPLGPKMVKCHVVDVYITPLRESQDTYHQISNEYQIHMITSPVTSRTKVSTHKWYSCWRWDGY